MFSKTIAAFKCILRNNYLLIYHCLLGRLNINILLSGYFHCLDLISLSNDKMWFGSYYTTNSSYRDSFVYLLMRVRNDYWV